MSIINRNVFAKSSTEVLLSGKQNYADFAPEKKFGNDYAVTRDGIKWSPEGLKFEMPASDDVFSFFVPSFYVSNDMDCPSSIITTMVGMKDMDGHKVMHVVRREMTSLPMRDGSVKDFYIERKVVDDKHVKLLTALDPVEMIGLKMEKDSYEGSGLDTACNKFYQELSDDVQDHICPAVLECPDKFDHVWDGHETSPLFNILDSKSELDRKAEIARDSKIDAEIEM